MTEAERKALEDACKNKSKEQFIVEFRIDRLDWECEAQITDRETFPYVTLRHVGFSKEPDRALLNDGWEYDGYDHYMDYSNYSKTVDIRSLKAAIVVEFTKLTDDRDRETFGFRERSMRGTYRYPIPEDLKDVITRCVHRSGDMTEPLRNLLKQRFGKTLPEDEYRALVRLKDEHLQALLGAIDSSLSEEEQKSAFAEASHRAERDNPAVDNIYESRSHVVEHRNFELAYDKAGIKHD